MHITDDLYRLLEIVPDQIRRPLQQHQDRNHLIEIVMDLGRLPEARFPSQVEYLGEIPISRKDLSYSIERIGTFSSDNRAGIEQTLHRISAMRNRKGEVIGLTCRVGRAVFGTIAMIRELVETGRSILMLGRPGVGKTTALREIARVLADELEKRVVIIDTSNEIAGDGDVPHTAIGRARRMQVASPEQQHRVMIEAVENHTPEVIVIDEIGTELEALAARTIAERGVQLVGTAHGNQIENLLKNPTLCDLIGGIQAVTLGDDEARRRGSQKTVLERKAPPTFEIAVEMLERRCWVVHEQVADTVDALLRRKKPYLEVRTMDDNGEVKIKREFNGSPGLSPSVNRNTRRLLEQSGEMLTSDGSFRDSGYMMPLPNTGQISQPLEFSEAKSFEQLLDESLSSNGIFSHSTESPWEDKDTGPNGEDLPLHIYPYAIPRHQMEQAITTLDLPVVLTKDIDSADVILALRSHTRKQSKLRHVAKTRHVPIHVIKNSGLPQIAKALRRLLDMEDPATPEFATSASEDEMEALEETRLAVEQIVIPKGQPVELLPRSPKVRKMQHELVEHYRLKSASFGDEPNRRLRIYPA